MAKFHVYCSRERRNGVSVNVVAEDGAEAAVQAFRCSYIGDTPPDRPMVICLDDRSYSVNGNLFTVFAD